MFPSLLFGRRVSVLYTFSYDTIEVKFPDGRGQCTVEDKEKLLKEFNALGDESRSAFRAQKAEESDMLEDVGGLRSSCDLFDKLLH
jgi:hypothetical protein